MHLTINEDGETTVREETRAGSRYLIAENVGIVKPMKLTNGYVPEESIGASVDLDNTHGGTGWDGTVGTLNHPRNDPNREWYDDSIPAGKPILSSNDGVTETLGLSETENDHWDGEYVRADIAVNADRAEEMSGEAADVVAALENNDPLNISSQYLGMKLPPGEYDGDFRTEAEAIVAPDSVALLPNSLGQCSVAHGCGVNPKPLAQLGVAANVAASATGVRLSVAAPTDDPETTATASSAETAVTGEDEDALSAGSIRMFPTPTANDLTPEQAALIEDVLEEFTDAQANATVSDLREWLFQNDDLDPDAATALEAALGDVFEETPDDWQVEDEFSDWLEAQAAETTANESLLSYAFGSLRDLFGTSDSTGDETETQTMGAESPVDTNTITNPTMNNTIDREELIAFITANSELKEDSLAHMGDQCLTNTHEMVVANAAMDEDADEASGESEAGGNDDESNEEEEGENEEEGTGEGQPETVVVELPEEHDNFDEYIDARVAQRVEATANRRTKEQRVERIVANSAEYDTEDTDELLNTPAGVLDRIERGLQGGFTVPGTTGPDVTVGANEDADLDDIEVGTGVRE